MENSAPGRHPLHVTGSKLAPVSQTVAVIDASRQHIGDGLDASVRMPWEPRAIILWTIVAEVVEQEEWIELAGITEAESATQLHACTFDRGLGLDNAPHRPNGHDDLISRRCSFGSQ